MTNSLRKDWRSARFNVFDICRQRIVLYDYWSKTVFQKYFFWVARILGNSLQLSIQIGNDTGSLYFLPSHTAWLSNGNSNTNGWVLSNPQQAEIHYLLSEIQYVQHEVVNIDILCKFVKHTTVKRTSLCQFMKLLKGLVKDWI